VPAGIFVFGGHLVTDQLLNDMWMFSSTEHRWLSIRSNATVMPASWGVQGVAALSNWPEPRHIPVTWSAGNKLYMMGGSMWSDLWSFDTTTLMWTWLGGSQLPNDYRGPVYGPRGQPTAQAHPGWRDGPINWPLTDGLLIYGGKVSEVTIAM
jgi:hypothetical protein